MALIAALRELPEAQRRALVLHHLADLSVEQVAEETGAPTGTVKARLSRGRAALAVLLTDPREGPRMPDDLFSPLGEGQVPPMASASTVRARGGAAHGLPCREPAPSWWRWP